MEFIGGTNHSGWIGRIPAIGDKNPTGFFHIVRRFFALVLIIGLAVLDEHGSACRKVGQQHRWRELKC